MLCPKCSNEVPEGHKFCTSCGANLEELAAMGSQVEAAAGEVMKIEDTSAAIKAKSRKLPIIIAAAAVVVIAAVLLIIFGGKGGKKASGGYEKFSSDEIYIEDGTIYCRTSGEVAELDEDSYNVQCTSLDRATIVLYSSEEEKLCVASKSGQKEITDSEIEDCAISLDGSTVVYIEKATSSKSNLMKYSVKSGKSEQLAEIKDKEGNPVAVSPDGGSVLYVDDGELYVYSKGKVTETGEKGTPAAIANGGKYVYFTKDVKGKTRLSVIAGGETKKIAETSSSYYQIYFNKTLSELFFYDYYEGTYYFSKDGAEGEKVKNAGLSISADEAYTYLESGVVFGKSTFIGMAYNYDNEIRVFTNELKSERIASKAETGAVFNSGKSVVYVDSKDNLYYIKDATKLEAEPEKIAEDIEATRLWVTPDGSLIYYLNEDDELHAITFKGKDTTIEEDVYDAVMDIHTGKLFYKNDGNIYSVSGTEKGEKIKLKKDASGLYNDYGNVIAYDVNGSYYLLLADGTFEKMN